MTITNFGHMSTSTLQTENAELRKALSYERKRADRLQADIDIMEKICSASMAGKSPMASD